MVCLAISGFCFNLVVPSVWIDDYLVIAALPAWAALAAYGMRLLCNRIALSAPNRSRSLQTALGAVALCALILTPFLVQRKRDPGFHRLVASGELANADPVLIAANGLNEGALIAEYSLVDPLRSHTILRGSKILAQSTWGGNRYRTRFASTPELRQLLESTRACLTLVQTAEPLTTDQRQLHLVLEQDPAWTLVASGPQIDGLEIYRRAAASDPHCR
jgi:hypothetical protein